MMTRRQFHCSAAALALAGCGSIPVASSQQLAGCLGARVGAISMRDTVSDRLLRSDGQRCRSRFRPASTFQLVIAIAALEAGVLGGAEAMVELDPRLYPSRRWWPRSWQGSHDLRSACAHGVTPWFRQLARRIGAFELQGQLARLGYGNQSIVGGVDRFWLDGDLAISADEQVTLLQALREQRLGVSGRTTRILESLMQWQRSDDRGLVALSGSYGLGPGRVLGWWIGWAERGSEATYFATNVEGSSREEVREARLEVTGRALQRVTGEQVLLRG